MKGDEIAAKSTEAKERAPRARHTHTRQVQTKKAKGEPEEAPGLRQQTRHPTNRREQRQAVAKSPRRRVADKPPRHGALPPNRDESCHPRQCPQRIPSKRARRRTSQPHQGRWAARAGPRKSNWTEQSLVQTATTTTRSLSSMMVVLSNTTISVLVAACPGVRTGASAHGIFFIRDSMSDRTRCRVHSPPQCWPVYTHRGH